MKNWKFNSIYRLWVACCLCCL